MNDGSGSLVAVGDSPLASDGGKNEGAAWVDYDNDGWVDLVVTAKEVNNGIIVYYNEGDGVFVRKDGVIDKGGAGDHYGMSWSDYDDDGDMDLFLAGPGANQVHRNDGEGVFTRLTEGAWVTDTATSVGGAWGDYDNDGDMDLYVTSFSEGEHNVLYRNNGEGTMTRVRKSVAVEEALIAVGSRWVDYDNDADLDLLVANNTPGGTRHSLFANLGDGKFEQIRQGGFTEAFLEDPTGAQAVALADFNADGFLDVYVATINNFSADGVGNQLFFNTPNGNYWLHVRCVGVTSNASAIGAKVKVLAEIEGEEVWQIREVRGADSYAGQDSLDQAFGLREASVVKKLRIEWPSGIIQEMTNVAVNQVLVVTEPDEVPGEDPDDVDKDGLSDAWELAFLGNLDGGPSDDPDGDTLTNLLEFKTKAHPMQSDTDGDGADDALEVAEGTNTVDAKDVPDRDFDGDGMSDRWEIDHFGDVSFGAEDDPDEDGLTNLREYKLGSLPNKADSDADGLTDGQETDTHGTDPLSQDTDGDFLTDGEELERNLATDPLQRDSDGDQLIDGAEIQLGRDPHSPDEGLASLRGLIHRYSFDASEGIEVLDSVGGANGEIKGDGHSWSNGALMLDGGVQEKAAYVDLPNDMITELKDFSIEVWFTHNRAQEGGTAIFFFGNSEVGEFEGPKGISPAFDFISTSASWFGDPGTESIVIFNENPPGGGLELQPVEVPDPVGKPRHFALTYDHQSGEWNHYHNGRLVNTFVFVIEPSDIQNYNNWLGRSPWPLNPISAVTYDELRMYDRTLSHGEIGASIIAGPDATEVLRPDYSGLIHRYAFDETDGRTVTDSVGDAHGLINGEGHTWDGNALVLEGGPAASAAYVDLPNGMISGLQSVSIETWTAVNDLTQPFARIFSFGTTDLGELTGVESRDYQGQKLFTLVAGLLTDYDTQRAGIMEGDISNRNLLFLDAKSATTARALVHSVVTLNGESGTMRYFRDGTLLAEGATGVSLSAIDDVNNWLGRSQFSADGNFGGRFEEMRVYDRPLSEEAVKASFAAGPDAVTAPPEPSLYAYEDFAYDAGPLVGRNGGFGFQGPWWGTPNYVVGEDDAFNGKHVQAEKPDRPINTITRRLANSFGENGTTLYLSGRMRAQEPFGEGFANGFYGVGLIQEGGSFESLFFGKGGSPNFQYGVEHYGGAGLVQTGDVSVVNEIAHVVLKLEFREGTDRCTLWVNPPRDGEPFQGTVNEDLDLGGDLIALEFFASGAVAFDDLRVGAAYHDMFIDVAYDAPVAPEPEERLLDGDQVTVSTNAGSESVVVSEGDVEFVRQHGNGEVDMVDLRNGGALIHVKADGGAVSHAYSGKVITVSDLTFPENVTVDDILFVTPEASNGVTASNLEMTQSRDGDFTLSLELNGEVINTSLTSSWEIRYDVTRQTLPEPALTIEVARSPDGEMRLTLSDDSPAAIEFSIDLTTWEVIATGVLDTYVDRDPDRLARPLGYYRAKR